VVSRGEVWWSEDREFGRRPFLVLTRDPALAVLKRPLVAPLTSRVRNVSTELLMVNLEPRVVKQSQAECSSRWYCQRAAHPSYSLPTTPLRGCRNLRQTPPPRDEG
jgi:hypothetical protein